MQNIFDAASNGVKSQTNANDDNTANVSDDHISTVASTGSGNGSDDGKSKRKCLDDNLRVGMQPLTISEARRNLGKIRGLHFQMHGCFI